MTDTIVQGSGKIRWIIFSIAFATFMCTLDNYIVNISLPTIARVFNIDINMVSLVVISYLLIMTGTILLFGKLGDRLGLVRVFITGYIIFVIGSLLCGISSSITMLVISRCIQGLGGSILYSIPSALIPKYLPATMRGMAFGIITTSAAIGFTLGSPLGGFITDHFNWQWIFLINVPVGIVAIIITLMFFPRDQKIIKSDEKFDITGMFLSFFWLVTLMYPLHSGPKAGWNSPSILISFSISVIIFLAFILWESKYKDPLLDIKIFHYKDFTYANMANFFVFTAAIGCNFVIPFYLINARAMKADKAGLIMIIFSLVNMFIGPIAGKASDKSSPKLLCLMGMVITIIACLVFAKTLYLPSLWPVIVFQVLTGISLGLFLSPNNNLIMKASPGERHGVAAGILRTFTNLGSFIGVGIFQAILNLSSSQGLQMTPGGICSGLYYALLCAAFLYLLSFVFSFLIKGTTIKE